MEAAANLKRLRIQVYTRQVRILSHKPLPHSHPDTSLQLLPYKFTATLPYKSLWLLPYRFTATLLYTLRWLLPLTVASRIQARRDGLLHAISPGRTVKEMLKGVSSDFVWEGGS